MDLAENLTCFVINRVLERRADDMDCSIALWTRGWWITQGYGENNPFARCSYREAIDIESERKNFEYPPKLALICRPSTSAPRGTFQAPGAVAIPKRSRRVLCARTTIVRPWPRWTYWFPASANSSRSQRERLDVLESRIREMNQDPANYWWYLDLRRFARFRIPGLAWASSASSMLTGIQYPRRASRSRTPGSLSSRRR